jgi:hypothetical protein
VSKPTPLVLDLPKSDPLYGLDLRAVIEYDKRTFRHLHDLLDERSREICRLNKELERAGLLNKVRIFLRMILAWVH